MGSGRYRLSITVREYVTRSIMRRERGEYVRSFHDRVPRPWTGWTAFLIVDDIAGSISSISINTNKRTAMMLRETIRSEKRTVPGGTMRFCSACSPTPSPSSLACDAVAGRDASMRPASPKMITAMKSPRVACVEEAL